ncbi:bifunctional metallophosphatase/5'-nucleotidase [Lactobacillus crispatus]|jgi:2',3'-cyclic nucleotide 2'-phosphodiesterase|uniref:Bifunctional metallophosphatase/5'-nucleotidase n=1 Tax=Lactobacillus crispatus TaxID=47770 RepID=A0A4R6CUN2_9LACO|nr:bifunctional UDP-sugar hydrolase/5'-nucleotidase [Lactobacillus crispatus]CPR67498.1 2'%2C3'-cyclic-nucleotide 2'-phosphodiesterase/3'-nucleotidase precursor [Chlamydia trachomatis]KWU14639.1 2', 3'-cyclic nucleotide 2'-phosphodiesterase [Lactobacillus crispatus]MBI1716752.1 2',3'-cyclic-nucleotide 2'-phosphodiesterase/3'-nucleotidase precursor [Lactobacillus crispatus]MBO4165719.1 bifunctional metallophosphatase/5'-nucleotidase [Lactobacillus crispatus]MBW0441250.1 bifunctional metallophos
MYLVFLHSSDTHGFLLPTDYQNKTDYHAPFSLSRVSSVIKSEKKKYGDNNVVVTDAGDCLQGSPLASYAHSTGDYSDLRIFTQAYNAVGYDARCLGNHDFNFGLDYLSYYVDNNEAPIINDNVLDAETEVPFFGREYTIIKRNGLKIGLLGITTQYIPHWEPKENVKGLKFASAYEKIKHYAKILRPQVDILAVMYHGGFESDPETGKATEPNRGENEGYQILTKIPEVDVLLTGHQHRRLNLVTRDTAIVQPGYRGEAVAEVVLDIDDDTKKIKSMSTKLIDTKDYDPDPVIVDIVSDLDKRTQKWLDQPIAHLDKPARIENAMKGRIEGAPFINLIQQMQLWFTKADVSATAVMSETAKGFDKTITMRDVLLNYPYANQLCRVKLTGKELRHIIEHSAGFLKKDEAGNIGFIDRWIKPKPMLYHFDVFYPVEYEADLSRPVGERLTKLTLHGKPIKDDQIYHLAVNNYRAMGGGFYPEYSMDKIETTLDKDYVQMFSEYLTHGPVEVDTKKNYKFY